jgi:hypothetical protein
MIQVASTPQLNKIKTGNLMELRVIDFQDTALLECILTRTNTGGRGFRLHCRHS